MARKPDPDRSPDPKRVASGRKGGTATRDRYGPEFFSRLGKAGGRIGGQTTRNRYGIEFYRRIGAKGGSR